MRLVLHLGRAAVIFWVGAILLPAAVVEATAPAPHRAPEPALHEVSAAAGVGSDGLGDLVAGVRWAEGDVERMVARVRLEVDRFIVRLP